VAIGFHFQLTTGVLGTIATATCAHPQTGHLVLAGHRIGVLCFIGTIDKICSEHAVRRSEIADVGTRFWT
jgi:hypothetical protein